MKNFKITCSCGHYITKNDNLFLINFYKLKTPLLKRTKKNERIIEETFYYYVCPKCEKDIIVINRKALNALRNIKVLPPEKLMGFRAEKYLKETENNRINKTSELKYNETGVYCKGVPMSYFKTIDGTHQRARYINECGYSGDITESKVIVHI